MTALGGLWRFGSGSDGRPLEQECRAILSAQREYGSGAPSAAVLGSAAFGRSLLATLPEDSLDAQPLLEPSRQTMLVADVRVDNRDEILQLLDRSSSAISDSEVFSRAYEAWGEGAFDRIVGDYAVAIWDAQRQLLTLARDPTGQRPLHYHVGAGFAAFASMPRGLHALEEVGCEVDFANLAGFVADIPPESGSTYFRGIARVPPGSLVEITSNGVRTRGFWRLPDRELRLPTDADYIEAFREELDRATRARLRRRAGAVGSHLSAGLDSNAVSASAARLLDPAGLLAVTSAPREGFDGPVPRGRIADESPYAAATASLHPNIEHLVLRPAGVSPLSGLARDSRLYQEPVGHPCNQSWLSSVSEAAHQRGVSVMLTGEAGNLTISAGGPALLADLLRTGRWRRWWIEAQACAANDMGWKSLLAVSFGPWVPRRAWSLLTRLNSGYAGGGIGASFLRDEWRDRVAPATLAESRGGRPEKDNRQLRLKLLQGQDMGSFRKGALARWGIDERDPTADRLLAEFCFALPPEQLLRQGQTRRLARVALADRLPPEILNGPRGYQFADWYESLNRNLVHQALDEIEGSPAALLLDFARLRQLIDRWPQTGWETQPVITSYRLALLRALSAGYFAAHACQ
ncbi:MAG TPA: asparagine synthase-related protein [Allosphingosinicella sp.]